MYTLVVVLLTLVIAWTIFYGVFRLAVYAAEHERDEFRGCGLSGRLEDRSPGTVIVAERAVATASDLGPEDPADDAAAARRRAGGAIVIGGGQT